MFFYPAITYYCPAFVFLGTFKPKLQLETVVKKEMAKSDAKKRAEMMAKEWKKSRSNTRSLNDLVGMGLLHNQELGGWRAPKGEANPTLAPMRS